MQNIVDRNWVPEDVAYRTDARRTATAGVVESPTPTVSIVVPTFNERANIAVLIDQLRGALQGIAWEVIFVDDNSPDGTCDAIRTEASRDPRVRCISRIGRRGLSGACIEGMLSSSARYIAVMDADLQHDASLLPRMLALLKTGNADLVIGSRYVSRGSAASFSPRRAAISQVSSQVARHVLKVSVADPMSGFFMMSADKFRDRVDQLSSQGFKILLDILSTYRGSLRVVELPYTFGVRASGESKLSGIVAFDFFGLLLSRLTRGYIPIRFLLFAAVGALGLLIHLAALRLALSHLIGAHFLLAQLLATTAAMTSNFFVNNSLTYSDRRLRGSALANGLLSFYAICGVGVVSNVGVAHWLYGVRPVWWLAGLAGAMMGALWNYSISSRLVWRGA